MSKLSTNCADDFLQLGGSRLCSGYCLDDRFNNQYHLWIWSTMISFFFHLLITSELESTKLATSQSLCGKEAARMEKVFWKLCYLSSSLSLSSSSFSSRDWRCSAGQAPSDLSPVATSSTQSPSLSRSSSIFNNLKIMCGKLSNSLHLPIISSPLPLVGTKSFFRAPLLDDGQLPHDHED